MAAQVLHRLLVALSQPMLVAVVEHHTTETAQPLE
jgi:hypothetical protein